METIIVGLILLAIVAAIIGKGIYNRLHHKGGGCSCAGGCESCGGCGCHTGPAKKS